MPALTSGEVLEVAAGLGRGLTEAQASGIAGYLGLLQRWNRVMNLVGPDDPRVVLRTLVADSWHLADFLGTLPLFEAPRSLDLGAGAGLPGVPLRLFWTPGEYWLVEAREKRAAFLRNCVATLKLPGTKVFAGRVEGLPAGLLPAGLVVGRAFMPWPEYLALAARLLRPGGFVVVLANEPPPREAERSAGLALAAHTAYPAEGRERYFWAFTPESISM